MKNPSSFTRCTTCRVRVTAGAEHCPPPAAAERAALKRCGAASDVRLACQLRPTGNVDVQPLLAVEKAWWQDAPAPPPTQDRSIAVLFVDLRPADLAATAHDTVYALEHFHALVDAAVADHGGVVVRHGGERWMAAFGALASAIPGSADSAAGSALRQPARDALAAALRIAEQGGALIGRLERELHWRADFSTGVAVGHAVVGQIGAGPAARLTVVGEALRGAERLQVAAAREGWPFVTSVAAGSAAGLDTTRLVEADASAADGAGRVLTGPLSRWQALLRAA